MKKEVLILCEDLFGLEAYSIIQESNEYITREKLSSDTYEIRGFFSIREKPFGDIDIDKPIYTSIQQWIDNGKYEFVMGIKDPAVKEKASNMIREYGGKFVSILTPWTIIPDNYSIGEGCLISNYSFKEGSSFEDFVTMINVMSETSHVGCFSTIDALTNITDADIGKRVMIGAHSFIIEHLTIGDDSIIYPGSMIFGNVKPGSTIAGIPANRAKYKSIIKDKLVIDRERRVGNE